MQNAMAALEVSLAISYKANLCLNMIQQLYFYFFLQLIWKLMFKQKPTHKCLQNH